MAALRGKRIVITRPRNQSDEWVRLFRREGADVIECPAIEIRGVIPESLYRGSNNYGFPKKSLVPFNKLNHKDGTVPSTVELSKRDGKDGAFDLLVFLSANGVEYFSRFLGAFKRKFTPIPVCVVGPATGATALRLGFHVKKTASDFSSEGVLKEIKKIGAKNVLIPRGKSAPPLQARSLLKSGIRITEWPVYETRSAPPPSMAMKRKIMRGVDAVIFTSPSTVHYFSRFFSAADRNNIFSQSLAVSIGSSTTGALIKNKTPNILQARKATPRDVISTLEHFFS